MKIIVIGIGSIGQRHIKNIRELGYQDDLFVYDTAVDVFQPKLGLPELPPERSIVEGLIQKYGVHYVDPKNTEHENIDAFIICTPPSTHMEYMVLAFQRGAHVFVEKPISNELQYMDWIVNTARNNDLMVQVGYQMRYLPGLQALKSQLKSQKILSIRSEYGLFLPKWHPNKDYHTHYAGIDRLGGGIILEDSHDIDYVKWLMESEVDAVSCFGGHLSNLDIDVEDMVEINLLFKNEAIANIHMDMVQNTLTRNCKVVTDKEELEWNYMLDFESDPYKIEMKDFLDKLQHRNFSGNLQESIDTLKIALAAKRSMIERKMIEL